MLPRALALFCLLLSAASACAKSLPDGAQSRANVRGNIVFAVSYKIQDGKLVYAIFEQSPKSLRTKVIQPSGDTPLTYNAKPVRSSPDIQNVFMADGQTLTKYPRPVTADEWRRFLDSAHANLGYEGFLAFMDRRKAK